MPSWLNAGLRSSRGVALRAEAQAQMHRRRPPMARKLARTNPWQNMAIPRGKKRKLYRAVLRWHQRRSLKPAAWNDQYSINPGSCDPGLLHFDLPDFRGRDIEQVAVDQNEVGPFSRLEGAQRFLLVLGEGRVQRECAKCFQQ